AIVSEDVQDLFFNAPARGRVQVPRVVGKPRVTQPPSTVINIRTHAVDAVVLKSSSLTHAVDAIVSADTQDLFFNRPSRGVPRLPQLPRYLGSRIAYI